MAQTQESLKLFFNEAFEDFRISEKSNILNGVAERNLCGRLAVAMESIKEKYGLSAYYADPEYDRKQEGKFKTILDGNMELVEIVADLLVHSRGELPGRDNLIAIEMKKAGRPKVETINDQNRLRAMTKPMDSVWAADRLPHPEHVCGYQLGFFIELNAAKRSFRIDEFREGEKVGETMGSF